MALITNNLNLYIAEVDDPNEIYVKGFADNFNTLDLLLKNLLATEIADVTSTENTTRRAVTDFMAHKHEGHILSRTDDSSAVTNEGIYGIYYGVNPHNVSPNQLYIPTADRTGSTGRLTASDGIVYEINNNLTMEGTGFARHRINWKIVNTQSGRLSEIGSSINDRPHSDLLYNTLDPSSSNTTKDKHLSNAQAKKYEDHVDTVSKTTSNPHNVSAQNLKSSDDSTTGGKAIQRAINQQGTTSGINWSKINKATSNLTDIVNRDHDDLQNIGEVNNSSVDTTVNKHISNLDMNKIYGHILSVGSSDGAIKDIDGNGSGLTNHQTAKINPHQVRAKDLWSDNTGKHKHGADTIIDEINTHSTSTGITTPNPLDKIYWNLIDKDNIDGLGNSANINSIPNRSHQELQNILPAVVTSSDTTKNKHVSNSQVKKYEVHVDDNNKISSNPHNLSAQNLKSTTSSNTGGKAIVESINDQASTNAIDWSKVNKATSNLTEITIRNHDDLQNINTLDPTSSNTTKNKHLSNAQAKQYQDHIETTSKSVSNPHNVSAQNLKSSDNSDVGGKAIQRAINNQGVDYGINWVKINKTSSNLTEITTRNHNDLQNIREVNVLDSNGTKDKHVNNALARKWDIHADYTSGGNIHRTTAYNLYTGGGEKKGGKAIAEAVNNQADSNAINWSKVSKSSSNLSELTTRNHDDLQNIATATSSTDGTKNKHISNVDFKRWQDHGNNIVNPHGVTPAQLGGNPIVNVINSSSTSVPINRNRLNFAGFNITEIENRNHDDLNSVGVADLSSSNTIQNKHVSNSQAKKWEDHVNTTSGTNVHNVKAKNIPIDIISGISGSNVQNALENIAMKTTYDSSGLLTHTGNIIINSSGVLAQANNWAMYHTSDFTGKLFEHTVPQKQFSLSDFTDNTINYIYAYYNTSTNTVSYETTDNFNLPNWCNQLLYGEVHLESGVATNVKRYSMMGNGATEKILLKDKEVNLFEIGNGLELEDDSDKAGDGVTPINHHFKVSSGTVWGSLERFQCVSRTTRSNTLKWYKTQSDGSWTHTDVSAPIVWKKDTGNGVFDGDGSLRNYAANWIYKDIVTDDWYIVLGSETYRNELTSGFVLGYADAQPPVNLPNIIKERSVLVGKVITEKGKTINKAIYRTQGILFTNTSTGFAPLTTHNTLQGLQGGTTGQYNHVTNSQISKINSVEVNADVTDIQNVGESITDIIYNNTSDANITIDEVYTMAKNGDSNMVRKAGERMTGTLSIQKTGLAFALGADSSGDHSGGSDIWFRMGNTSYAFNHVYKGSESGNDNAYELWTTRDIGAYNSNSSGRVWRITQDGIFNIYKNIISSSDIKSSTLNVTSTANIGGQTKIKKGSTDWKDTIIETEASIELGQDGGGYAGSIKLYGSDTARYGLIRMHKTNMFFDTSGKYYINWDKTDTAGELYLGDGVAHNTVEETRANYLVLRSNDKSYFKNGLQVGTTSNRSGYAMNVGGSIDMAGNDVNYLNQVHFQSGTRLRNINTSTFQFMADHSTVANIDFHTGGSSGAFKGRVRVDGNNFGLQNKDNQWIIANSGADTVLYNAGNAKIRATSTGATINGILAVDTSISEGGTTLASKYLGLTAKAADSEKIDGIDSSRIIYGDNSTGTIAHSSGDASSYNKAGFYRCQNGVSGIPMTYGSLVHIDHPSSNDYYGQIFIGDDASSRLFFRSKSDGTTWHTVYSTHNKPTKTDVGLGNLPNAKSDSISLDDTNVLATSKAVKQAYDLASAASASATNADNAQKLDNLYSTQFIRSDVDDTATGILTVNNDMRVRNMMFMSSNSWSHSQKGNIVYNHSDTETDSIIPGVNDDNRGHFKIGHSESGIGTSMDLETILVHTGDIYMKEAYIRKNVSFIKAGARKASIEYNETTNSLDFVF